MNIVPKVVGMGEGTTVVSASPGEALLKEVDLLPAVPVA